MDRNTTIEKKERTTGHPSVYKFPAYLSYKNKITKQGVSYGDCKDYLYCFDALAVQFVFCLPGKPLGITKKYVIALCEFSVSIYTLIVLYLL
jgi:hypothetical protein